MKINLNVGAWRKNDEFALICSVFRAVAAILSYRIRKSIDRVLDSLTAGQVYNIIKHFSTFHFIDTLYRCLQKFLQNVKF